MQFGRVVSRDGSSLRLRCATPWLRAVATEVAPTKRGARAINGVEPSLLAIHPRIAMDDVAQAIGATARNQREENDGVAFRHFGAPT
jgi:hypothetical protein